jgi:hypothetical protein
MGMFDRDEPFGDAFKTGDRFVLLSLSYEGVISTRMGEAEKSRARIVSRDHPTEQKYYSVLGVGIARMAKQAEAADFPCVVELIEVPTGKGDQRVKLLAPVDVAPRAFIDGDDGPEAKRPDTAADPLGSGAHVAPVAEDDIPF